MNCIVVVFLKNNDENLFISLLSYFLGKLEKFNIKITLPSKIST